MIGNFSQDRFSRAVEGSRLSWIEECMGIKEVNTVIMDYSLEESGIEKKGK